MWLEARHHNRMTSIRLPHVPRILNPLSPPSWVLVASVPPVHARILRCFQTIIPSPHPLHPLQARPPLSRWPVGLSLTDAIPRQSNHLHHDVVGSSNPSSSLIPSKHLHVQSVPSTSSQEHFFVGSCPATNRPLLSWPPTFYAFKKGRQFFPTDNSTFFPLAGGTCLRLVGRIPLPLYRRKQI